METSCGMVTRLSGFTEKGKFSALGSRFSDGATRLSTRHSRRREAKDVRLSGA